MRVAMPWRSHYSAIRRSSFLAPLAVARHLSPSRGAIHVRRAANVHGIAWMCDNVFRGTAALRLAIDTASLRDRGSPADTLPASIFLVNPARISPGMP